MATNRLLTMFATILATSAVSACNSIGPGTVQRDRMDYGSAIGDSWKQQTLANIVKLRYGDMPVFLEIAQVIAGYQLESTVGTSFTAGTADAATNSGTVGLFSAGGSVAASGRYIDRPTLIYAPLTGTSFLKQLATPIPPGVLLFLLQSGYAADRVMPLILNSINGVRNASSRGGVNHPADPQFYRLTQLIRESQLNDELQIRIERPKTEKEAAFIILRPSVDPAQAAIRDEIRSILHLKPNLLEFAVFYGGDSGKDDEISMMTRSMLQIMQEMAALVQVPASDVANGRASPGAVSNPSPGAPTPPTVFNVLSSDVAPKDAYVSVQYNGRWFWIANTDLRTKTLFGTVMILFSVSETGPATSAPVVTVPAN